MITKNEINCLMHKLENIGVKVKLLILIKIKNCLIHHMALRTTVID